MNRLLVCLVVLATGCQSTPQLRVTSHQQNELATITALVAEHAKTMLSENMSVNRDTVDLLLKAQDANVKAILDDQQWKFYDTSYRARLATRIYRTEVKKLPPDFQPDWYQYSLLTSNAESP